MSKKVETKSTKSNSPMLIIVGVLVVAVLAGWWFYSSSKPAAGNKVANTANSNGANTAATKPPVIPANAPIGANPPNQSGSPTATVKLEEFADFQCGSCASAHPAMNEIKSMYGSRIHFVFRNYPLDIPIHDKSYDAAVAAEAAGLQGKFWDMQNLLFSNQQAWTKDPTFKQMWKEYAKRIGLDVAKWETDMAGIVAKGRVDEDIKRGKGLNVNSTPTLYINGTSVDFSQMKVESLKQLIDAELSKKQLPKVASEAVAAE